MSTDALALIAEAQSRQRKAEMDRDHWREVAQAKTRRCKRLVAMLRSRPLPVPSVDQDGYVDQMQLLRIIDDVVPVFADPYAALSEDDDDLTHSSAKHLLALWLGQMIEAAVRQAMSKPGAAA